MQVQEFVDHKEAHKRLRGFRKEQRVKTSSKWVNSDFYLDKNIPYVYLIRHKETGVLYAGSKFAKNAKPSKFFVKYFTSSDRVKELGWENFEVLEVRATKKARDHEAKLLQKWYKDLGREEFCKIFLNRNLSPGIILDEDIRRKQSSTMCKDIASGNRNPPSFLGGHHSSDSKARIGATLKGRVLSDSTRKKISVARSGIVFTEDHCAKLSAARRGRPSTMLGKKHSIETRQKISLAKKGTPSAFKGRVHSAKSRSLMSASAVGRTNWLGRKHSKESRSRMVASWVIRKEQHTV